MRIINIFLLIFFSFLFFACSEEVVNGVDGQAKDDKPATTYVSNFVFENDDVEMEVDTEAISNFVSLYNQFAIDLYSYDANTFVDSNVTSSPISLFNTLGMTMMGAEGETLDQIVQAFAPGFSNDEWPLFASSISTLNKASAPIDGTRDYLFNAVWGQQDYLFLESYLTNLSSFYQIELAATNFIRNYDYRGEINEWADAKSNGQFYEIAPYLNSRGRAHVASLFNVDQQLTSMPGTLERVRGIFEKLDNIQYWVPMNHWSGDFNSYEDEELSAFELPVKDDDISLIIVMPKDGVFQSIEQSLKDNFDKIINSLEPSYTDIFLPDFSIETSRDGDLFLEDRGMTVAFIEESANFSAVNGLGYNYLEGFSHDSRITIDESSLHVVGISSTTNVATFDEPFNILFPRKMEIAVAVLF